MESMDFPDYFLNMNKHGNQTGETMNEEQLTLEELAHGCLWSTRVPL
jgi:hypothetical protein